MKYLLGSAWSPDDGRGNSSQGYLYVLQLSATVLAGLQTMRHEYEQWVAGPTPLESAQFRDDRGAWFPYPSRGENPMPNGRECIVVDEHVLTALQLMQLNWEALDQQHSEFVLGTATPDGLVVQESLRDLYCNVRWAELTTGEKDANRPE